MVTSEKNEGTTSHITDTEHLETILTILNAPLVSHQFKHLGFNEFHSVSALLVVSATGKIKCNLGSGRLLQCNGENCCPTGCGQGEKVDTIRRLLMQQHFFPSTSSRFGLAQANIEQQLELWVIKNIRYVRTLPCGMQLRLPPTECANFYTGSPIEPTHERDQPRVIPLGSESQLAKVWWS